MFCASHVFVVCSKIWLIQSQITQIPSKFKAITNFCLEHNFFNVLEICIIHTVSSVNSHPSLACHLHYQYNADVLHVSYILCRWHFVEDISFCFVTPHSIHYLEKQQSTHPMSWLSSTKWSRKVRLQKKKEEEEGKEKQCGSRKSESLECVVLGSIMQKMYFTVRDVQNRTFCWIETANTLQCLHCAGDGQCTCCSVCAKWGKHG